MDLTEAEDIKKRWQEYTEELYKKDLHNPDNHDGVITDLEPDILECEVKWALESITTTKASGGDGIPVELFQILKDDAVKVLHSICQQIWKTQQWPQDWKRSVFIPIPKKGQTDYILCSQRWRSSIQSAKTRLGADSGSDHEFLIAKFRLKLKKVGKTIRPFRYDLNQIPYDYTVEVRNRFKGLDLIECLMNY